MRFLRWRGYTKGGRQIPFYLLEEELEKNAAHYLYVNVAKSKLFRDIYNRCFRGARLKKNARVTTWKKVEVVYNAALQRMGIEEWECRPFLLCKHKCSTVLKIPFENYKLLEEFGYLRLAEAEKKLNNALKRQEKGEIAVKGRELVCQSILPCKAGEHAYGFFLGKEPDIPSEPRHPRYYCWLSNIRKLNRLALLHVLTGLAWVEIDIINAIPQGICRMAGCQQSLSKMSENKFLSQDPIQREQEKLILAPDTFRLLSSKVTKADKAKSAKNLKQFFRDCPDEWSRYICTVEQMENVHDLFNIEEVMRRFLLGHPYALNIHDATFLPANRIADIEELIAALKKENIYFKVSLHRGIDTQDITNNYKEVLLGMDT